MHIHLINIWEGHWCRFEWRPHVLPVSYPLSIDSHRRYGRPRQAPPPDRPRPPIPLHRKDNEMGKKRSAMEPEKFLAVRLVGKVHVFFFPLFLCPFRTRVDDCASLVIGERWRGGHQLSTYSVQSVASLPVSWSHSRWSVGRLNLRQRKISSFKSNVCAVQRNLFTFWNDFFDILERCVKWSLEWLDLMWRWLIRSEFDRYSVAIRFKVLFLAARSSLHLTIFVHRAP